MATRIEVLFTPTEFRDLPRRDLSNATCVVFDVLRASSAIVTALANGAEAVIPVAEIPKALALRQRQKGLLLAGERNGLRITASLTGGVDFDLGNSPREYTRARVEGRTIASTTTNGTRALRACANARCVIVGCLLNLTAAARFVAGQAPQDLILVCAGTFEETALEDVLTAGVLCETLLPLFSNPELLDSARIALAACRQPPTVLHALLTGSQNARRLASSAELSGDVEFCLERDRYEVVPMLGPDGVLRSGKSR